MAILIDGKYHVNNKRKGTLINFKRKIQDGVKSFNQRSNSTKFI